MRDALETQLAELLHELGDSLPDQLEPPPDLELRIARRRRHSRTSSRLAFSSIAAVLVVAVAALTVVAGTPTPTRIPHATGVDEGAVVTLDPLPAGIAMLDSHDAFVVGLDRTGHQIATLISARRGNIIDAQLTSDHRSLWYLSVAGRGGVDCGEVVRAEILTGVSTIVAHAVSFAVSPDGARLALAGGGIQTGLCTSLAAPPRAQVVVTDTRSGSVSTWTDNGSTPARGINQMRWSPDGRHIVTRICAETCEQLVAFDVPEQAGAEMQERVIDRSGFLGIRPPASFGSRGLYVLERNVATTWRQHRQAIVVLDTSSFRSRTTVLDVDYHWDLVNVVPVGNDVFVVGTPRDATGAATGPRGLYEVEHDDLVPVRAANYGSVTPVFAAA